MTAQMITLPLPLLACFLTPCAAQDHEDPAAVSDKLDTMGYGIGQRLIDELLAKSNVGQVLRITRAQLMTLHAGVTRSAFVSLLAVQALAPASTL